MLLEELTDYLATQNIIPPDPTGARNLFYGVLPPDPDVVLALNEYGGRPPEHDLGTNHLRLEFPRVQVLARGIKEDYVGPRVMLDRVVEAMVKVIGVNLNGVRYLSISPLHSPYPLRRDNNFRVECIVDFEVTKEISPLSTRGFTTTILDPLTLAALAQIAVQGTGTLILEDLATVASGTLV